MSDPPSSIAPTSPVPVSPTWDLLFADWGQQVPLAVDSPHDDSDRFAEGDGDDAVEDGRFIQRPAIPIVVTGRELQADTHGYRQTVQLTALARAADLMHPFTDEGPIDRTQLALQIDDAWHECLDRLDLGTGLVRLTMRPAAVPLGPVVDSLAGQSGAGQSSTGQSSTGQASAETTP